MTVSFFSLNKKLILRNQNLYLSSSPVQIDDFEGIMSNEDSLDFEIAKVETFCIVLKSIATTWDPEAAYKRDSWHFIFTGAPMTEVIPTQHDERTAEEAVASQTRSCNQVFLYQISDENDPY